MWRTRLLAVLLAGTAVTTASAQSIVLEEIVVAGSEGEQTGEAADADAGTPSDTPAGSSVSALDPRLSPEAEAALAAPEATTILTRGTLQREQGRSVADALQSVPGVLVTETADDPGISINIRGMQEFDRVAVTVDGARQNFSRSGHSANGSVYIDQRMIKSVDITRGPIQAVGGSAVGGTVAFQTIDPDDVLLEGERYGARVESTVETNGPGGKLHGEAAWRINEAFDVLAAATVGRSSDYVDGIGDTVISASDLMSGLAKVRMRNDDGHETTLTAMRLANNFDNGISTVRYTEQTDDTVTLGHRWDSENPYIDLTAKAYYSGTHLDQKDRTGPYVGSRRSFDIKTYGGEFYNASTYEIAGFENTTTVGGDGFYDDVTSEDDRGLANGNTPSGQRGVYGVYVQHEIKRGWFELIGALRYDGYVLDGVDHDNNEDIHKDGGHLSPKITLAVTPVDPVTLYASYSEAFRSPSVTETLVQGVHPAPAFPFYPNPNLNPEIAHNIEAGVNLAFNDLAFKGDRMRLKGSVFHNTVDDYIDTVCTSNILEPGCTYENVTKAKLYGFELDALYDTGRVYGRVTATYIESKDEEDDEPLGSVQPWRVSGTLGARALHGKLDAGATLTYTAAKDDESLDITSEAYTLLDAYVNYDITEDTAVRLTLKNILNKQYTQYLDLEPSPGFSAFLTVSHRFGGGISPALAQGDAL
ncbi:TonB-dependent hemoglobin/transferrin/lactoferrin family receptor [Acuticoccus sediminis]|uniref:TonB-dependent hemoglobin/transferrin/lactoferrin family receptor n=1 Tax=Acuticoccus sediminis TaxID=2184697 RepID=UPI001CFD78C7|nr:TonB-dependent hemoglobin/transferrin/lactoferrin family receptor [Acuticoccus sediminis]